MNKLMLLIGILVSSTFASAAETYRGTIERATNIYAGLEGLPCEVQVYEKTESRAIFSVSILQADGQQLVKAYTTVPTKLSSVFDKLSYDYTGADQPYVINDQEVTDIHKINFKNDDSVKFHEIHSKRSLKSIASESASYNCKAQKQ